MSIYDEALLSKLTEQNLKGSNEILPLQAR